MTCQTCNKPLADWGEIGKQYLFCSRACLYEKHPETRPAMPATEYRIRISEPDKPDMATPATENPKAAADEYKYRRQHLTPNETIELQKRPTGPWETIEREPNTVQPTS